MFCSSYLWCHDCGYLPLMKCDKTKHQRHHIVYNNLDVCRMCYYVHGLIKSHNPNKPFDCNSYKKFKKLNNLNV